MSVQKVWNQTPARILLLLHATAADLRWTPSPAAGLSKVNTHCVRTYCPQRSLYTWTHRFRCRWVPLLQSLPLPTTIYAFPCFCFFCFTWKRFLSVAFCPAMCVFVPLLAVTLHGPPNIFPHITPPSVEKKKEKFSSPTPLFSLSHLQSWPPIGRYWGVSRGTHFRCCSSARKSLLSTWRDSRGETCLWCSSHETQDLWSPLPFCRQTRVEARKTHSSQKGAHLNFKFQKIYLLLFNQKLGREETSRKGSR